MSKNHIQYPSPFPKPVRLARPAPSDKWFFGIANAGKPMFSDYTRFPYEENILTHHLTHGIGTPLSAPGQSFLEVFERVLGIRAYVVDHSDDLSSNMTSVSFFWETQENACSYPVIMSCARAFKPMTFGITMEDSITENGITTAMEAKLKYYLFPWENGVFVFPGDPRHLQLENPFGDGRIVVLPFCETPAELDMKLQMLGYGRQRV